MLYVYKLIILIGQILKNIDFTCVSAILKNHKSISLRFKTISLQSQKYKFTIQNYKFTITKV